ncbi:MAG: hypothetical protein IAF08_03975 [Rhizobacter sp.]|nr:hypothetical protein [Chlorobiales bacterium]
MNTTIEFRAHIKDGFIEIPAEYRDEIKGSVKVVLLTEESVKDVSIIESLLNLPHAVGSFTPLTRTEIYGRE